MYVVFLNLIYRCKMSKRRGRKDRAKLQYVEDDEYDEAVNVSNFEFREILNVDNVDTLKVDNVDRLPAVSASRRVVGSKRTFAEACSASGSAATISVPSEQPAARTVICEVTPLPQDCGTFDKPSVANLTVDELPYTIGDNMNASNCDKEFAWVFDRICPDMPTPSSTADTNPSIDLTDADFIPMHCTEDPSPNVSDKTDPIYPGASMNISEAMVAILSYMQSEHLSGQGLDRLLALISLFLPEPNNFIKSARCLFKHLGNRDDPVEVRYFCDKCYKPRSSQSDLCDSCEDPSRSVLYFIHCPIIPQVRQMYERPGFVNDLRYRFNRVKVNPDNYEDVYDCDLYKEQVENGDLSNPHNISFTWNTDGLEIYESNNFQIWPWFLVVNELPPDKRYLSENMILGGMSRGQSKPHPNIYLQPMFKEIQTLKNGISVNFYGERETHEVKCVCLRGVCDAPALALFLNIKTHSGFYSCHVCKIKGENSERTGDVTVFPYEENPPLRTMNEYEGQVKWAVDNRVLHKPELTNNPLCCGIKGPTLLSYMVENMFKSTGIDSMHCIYLGCARQLLHLMFDHCWRKEPFSVHDKIETVTARLLQIHVPHFVQRCPQPLEKLVHWKASELRSFLFYFALCVLHGILKQDYFEHFMLLVEGVALLNSSSISNENIVTAASLLDKFVADFQKLYGLRHMSHNIHMLLHLPLMVTLHGPLQHISCFKFEDMNGRLTRLVHGTRYAGLQIHNHLSIVTKLPLMSNSLQNNSIQSFCNQLKSKSARLNITEKISEGISCVGSLSRIEDGIWIVDVLIENGMLSAPESEDRVLVFHRLFKNKMLYVANSYEKGKRNSSFVKYSNDGLVCYGNVEVFTKVKKCACPVDVYCICKQDYIAIVRPASVHVAFQSQHVAVHHILKCEYGNDVHAVDVSSLNTVVYSVDVNNVKYVCEPMNSFELE